MARNDGSRIYSATYSNVGTNRIGKDHDLTSPYRSQYTNTISKATMSCAAGRMTGSMPHTSSKSQTTTNPQELESSKEKCRKVCMRRSRAVTENTKVSSLRSPKWTALTLCSGTWIPLEDGRNLAERNGVLEKLLPILDYVAGDSSPPPAPKHATAASRPRAPRASGGQRRAQGML